MNIKIALIIVSMFSLYQLKQMNDLDNEVLLEQQKADSLENVILINDSIIVSIKSEFVEVLKQVEKDSINVESFKRTKPKKIEGLNLEELNNQFDNYFKSKRSK